MTDARLQIFVDCPYGGCEDGYCACLEQNVDEDYFAEFDDEEMDPDEFDELFGYVPERTVRRYCPACGQVVHADEDDPDRVPGHNRYGSSDLTRCSGSRTRQSLEPAP